MNMFTSDKNIVLKEASNDSAEGNPRQISREST